MTARIVPLAAVDGDAIEALLDRAFGATRKERTAYRLRAGTAWLEPLSFGLVDEGEALIGSIQAWPLTLAHDGGESMLVMTGPVAVDPTAQGRGHGRTLMKAHLAAAEATGMGALMMIGDPDYYGRFFGFSAEATAGWQLPGPVERHRLLARLAPGTRLPREGTLLPRTVALA